MKLDKLQRIIPRPAPVYVLMLLLLIAFLAAGCSRHDPEAARFLEAADSQCRDAVAPSREYPS